jgi:uncharacterized protein involved in response to NO
MALVPLSDPVLPSARRRRRFALFALGFRPFYLLASLFAALAVPVWVAVLSGAMAMPMPGVWWHAHEMLFGFAAAVIVGFLFTAGRNWTGLDTPTGAALAALAALWLAGRVAMAINAGIWGAVVDLLFLPLAALALWGVLRRARSRRNYFLVGILSVLSLTNLAFHLGRLGAAPVDPLQALHFALGIVIVLETTIGGRVIPGFTATAIKGVAQWQNVWLNRAAIAGTGLALLSWAAVGDSWPGGALCLFVALLQGIRCLGWNPWAARRASLLWILHASHFWIPLGLVFLGLAQWGWLPRAAGIHALTIGATGGLIIGMITRTALGHTGRPLVAGRPEVAAYLLVQLAAITRVLPLVVFPAAATMGIHVAALAWSAAFLVYLGRYLPWLLRPRADGQAG